jgi:ABC-type transport system involved in multi-copper enzyme maturation permease subunit
MNSTAPTSVPAAVAPNLRNAFGGVWRLTYPRLFTPAHLLSFLGLLVLLGVIGSAMQHAHASGNGYLRWTIDSYFTFLVPLIAFITSAGAIREDMKPGTVDYVLTRPIPRHVFVLYRYVAHVVGAQIEFLVAAGVVAAVGLIAGSPDLKGAIPLLLFGQMLLVFAFTAFGFLCGVLTSRYVVLGLAYGAIVEVGVGQIPTPLSRLSMTHQVRTLLESRLSAGEVDAMAGGHATTVLVVVVFSAIALALAAAAYHLREHTGAPEA